jgi:hypothetical protein
MLSLNLRAHPPVKIPASDFPNRADIYVCDQCGRDITKYLRRGHAHAWEPMGPVRYKCVCGKKYLTGGKEWDHFSQFERSKRIRETTGIGILLSAISSILGFIVYLVLHLVFGFGRPAIIVATVITWFPFIFVQVGFWPKVFASILRTRFGAND